MSGDPYVFMSSDTDELAIVEYTTPDMVYDFMSFIL
jgi:hypothetical protein